MEPKKPSKLDSLSGMPTGIQRQAGMSAPRPEVTPKVRGLVTGEPKTYRAGTKRVRRGEAGELIGLRLHPELLARLDKASVGMTRQEAIRAVLERELPK